MLHSVSRRRFLKDMGAVALAASVPSAKVRRATGAPDVNDRVIIGLMGAQIRGQTLVNYFMQIPNVDIAYVCDVDEGVAGKCGEIVKQRQARPVEILTDFRRVLDDNNIDGLVVAAPDHWHALATVLACEAGKHVYCEKPVSHNYFEGKQMVAAARKHQRVVQSGTQRRSSESLRAMVDFLHSGGIGRLHFARSWITSRRERIGHAIDEPSPPQGVNYDMWLGPAPSRPFNRNHFHYNWHWQWEYGTGEIGNNGVHGLDLARWGLGVELPKTVSSNGGKYVFEDDQVTPDTQIACFEYPHSLLMWEHRTWSPHQLAGSNFGVEYHGTKGVVTTDGKSWVIGQYGETPKPGSVPATPFEPVHQLNWVNCIRSGSTPAADIAIGSASAALCHFANISQRVGRQLEWNSETERFDASNGDANELLTREYREPWVLPDFS